MEEVGSVSIGRGGERKERQLVCVVGASSPYYLYGDVEDVYDGDDTPLPKPIVGAYAVVGESASDWRKHPPASCLHPPRYQ